MLNGRIGRISSLINLCAVAGFAASMLIGSEYGSYLFSMFIAFSFVPMMCAYAMSSQPEQKTAGWTAMVFSGMYATFILLVYFAQMTAVRLGGLNEQALMILDYSRFGLFFSYDLLGYSLMALATFFAGFTVIVQSKSDLALKCLLMIHGIFFVSCLILPMLGLFTPDMAGADWIGVVILEFWCLYFIPIDILSFRYFKKTSSNLRK